MFFIGVCNGCCCCCNRALCVALPLEKKAFRDRQHREIRYANKNGNVVVMAITLEPRWRSLHLAAVSVDSCRLSLSFVDCRFATTYSALFAGKYAVRWLMPLGQMNGWMNGCGPRLIHKCGPHLVLHMNYGFPTTFKRLKHCSQLCDILTVGRGPWTV